MHPPLFFNGIEVKRVTEHKHLGLILDPRLDFAAHIKEKSATARKGIGLIKHLRSYLPLDALKSIYTMHVRSILDYCDFIFHIPELIGNFSTDINLSNQMKILESLQYQAGLAVTGMWQGTNRDKVYEELGWESLHLRRWIRRLTVFYKIMTGLTPQYLRDPVPPPRSHLYGTSSTNDLHPMRCRTQRFQNSFYPDAVNCWNEIGPDIRKLDTLKSFKSNLTGIIKPNEDTPNASCLCSTGAETTDHFLLFCPIFKAHREKLMDTVNPIVSRLNPNFSHLNEILLYGSDSLDEAENKSILEATLSYIINTGRFSP